MKNTKWLRRTGATLLGGMMAISSVSMQMSLPVAAEETNSDQMVSAPEIVPVTQINDQARTVNLNSGWKFTLSDPANAQNSTFDDSLWESVNLPHDYSIDQEYTAQGEAESGYKLGGVGWYRKSFTLGSSFNKRVVVEFNGVYMDCQVYLNGHKLGEHPYGYTGFAFDLTDYLNKDGENVLAVRVNHQTPSSRWYSGSGIYRDVNLTITDAVHVGYDGVVVSSPNLKAEKDSGTVTTKTKVDVVNDSDASKTVTVKNTIIAADGTEIGTKSSDQTVAANAAATVEQDIAASSPELWSTENPNLYTLKTEILDGPDVIDTVETSFGYRYFEFDRNTGFSLNGKKTKLKGVCMHHDQGALGAAADDRAMERQIQIMKKMGVNAIRITHNPGDPDFIAACSREGILVINEILDGWIGSKNGNSMDYARFFNQTVGSDNEILNKKDGEKWSQFDVRAAVQESRNEPSVIMYSLGNEIFEGSYDWSAQSGAIAKELIAGVKENNTDQLVTFGGNKLKRGGTQENAVADAITEAGGVVGANYFSSGEFDGIFNQHTGWTLYGSETASHVNSRGVYNVLGSQALNSDLLLTSYDYSAVGWGKSASDAWYTTITSDYNAGEFVWTGFDYLGEPTPKNGTGSGWTAGTNSPKNSYFGIVDTAGLPKDNYYLYQSLWNEDVNTLHVLPAWNRDAVTTNGNGKVPVVVYSDAPSVELFFTPKGSTERTSLGKKTFTEKTTDAGYTYQLYEGAGKQNAEHRNLYLTWDVEYQDGKIEAVAYDKDGNQITDTEGRSFVETADAFSNIELEADRPVIDGDGTDLSYVTISLTDSDGTIVPTAKNNVKVTVEGAGELAGLDNGVQPDHQSYRDNNRKAQAGQLVAIIRSNGKAGDITVKASADGVESEPLTIKANEVAGETGDSLASFEYSRIYYVKTGTKPSLPSTITAHYNDGTSDSKAVVWEDIDDAQVAESGTFSVRGTCDGQTVSVTVYVIDAVSSLLNVSQVVAKGVVPTLPETRRAVLDDGEILDASFEVDWQMPEASAFAEAGTVEIPGTATVFGQTVPVKAYVRVADAEVTLAESVTPAAKVSQSIPADLQSDSLEAIKDGDTEYKTVQSGPNTSVWSNYDYCFDTPENKTCYVDFEYDTQQTVGQIKIHFASDGWSASYPDANTTKFEISEDGTNWKELQATETIGEATGNQTCYTYNFAPVSYTFLRVNFTNPDGKKPGNNNNKCLAVTEVEQFKAVSSIVTYGDAELESLTLGGEAVDAAMLATKTVTTKQAPVTLEFTSKNNGAVTVLPVINDTQVLLVEAEDASDITKYTIQYNTADPSDDYRDIDRTRLTAEAGSAQEPGNAASCVLDNNTGTHWHTAWDPKADNDELWIVLKSSNGEEMTVDGLRYLPRTEMINGLIYTYRIEALGADGEWTTVAEGDFERDNSTWKRVQFNPVKTTAIRLFAVDSHEDNAGRHASAAELRLTGSISDGEELDYTLIDQVLETKDDVVAGSFKSTADYTKAWNSADSIRNTAVTQEALDDAAIALNQELLKLRLNPSKEALDNLK